jgi:hypothetical protein
LSKTNRDCCRWQGACLGTDDTSIANIQLASGRLTPGSTDHPNREANCYDPKVPIDIGIEPHSLTARPIPPGGTQQTNDNSSERQAGPLQLATDTIPRSLGN